MPLIISNTNRYNIEIVAKGKLLPSIKEVLSIFITFGLTLFAWIFFRATSVSHAIAYISEIFSYSLFTQPYFPGMGIRAILMVLLIGIFIIIEWLGREQQYAIKNLGMTWYRPVRWAMYYAIIIAIYSFAGSQQEFVYFQF